jgi:hypothetical protein
MKLTPSVGCRILLAALTITLLSASQFVATAADVAISWGNPADIVYGTALGATQQDATVANKDTGAAVTGNFTYNPVAGTVLPAGTTQALTVTFTPTNATNEGVNSSAVSKTVYITVTKAPLTVTAPNRTSVYGGDTNDENTEIPALITSSSYAALGATGLVNGDTLESALGSPRAAIAVATVSSSTPANTSHAITFTSKSASANYDVTWVNGTLTVGKKPVTISASDYTTTYGHDFEASTVAKSVTVSSSSIESHDASKIVFTQVHNVDETTFAGSYDVSIVPSETVVGALANYSLTLVAGTITVEPRGIDINLYGTPSGGTTPQAVGPFNVNYGTAHPAWTAQYTIDTTRSWDLAPLTTGDALKATTGVIVTPAVVNGLDATVGYKATAYKVTVSGASFYGNNFDPTYVSGSTSNYDSEDVFILRVPLTLAPVAKTMVVGSVFPALDYSVATTTPLKFNDTVTGVLGDNVVATINRAAANISATEDGTTLTVANSPYTNGIKLDLKTGHTLTATTTPGVYTVGNYTVDTRAEASLTVTPVTSNVTWSLAKSAITYGDAFSTGTGTGQYNNVNVAVTTLQPGTTTPIAGDWSWSYKMVSPTAGTASASVNTATMAAKTLGAGVWQVTATFTPSGTTPNWGATSVVQNITVQKKEVTVTPNSPSFAYGGTVPTITVTPDPTDFVLNDSVITTLPTVTHAVTSASNVGEYTITPAGGSDDNYSFEYKSGKITVTPQQFSSISWTPAATTIQYGKTLSEVG